MMEKELLLDLTLQKTRKLFSSSANFRKSFLMRPKKELSQSLLW